MGYTTDFEGKFTLDKPLTAAQVAYLKKFCDTRRMQRDAARAMEMPDPARLSVDLPIGTYAEFFVGGLDFAGQGDDASVLDHNIPPPSQPGLWCQWVPSDDGTAIEWNGVEEFYNYVEWLEYIVERFIKRWGLILDGEVEWRGEDPTDLGKIIVRDNVVSTKTGRVTCTYADD